MAKYNPKDPETLKVPAFQRKVAITNHARQKLLWTALDRKEAGVKPNSDTPLSRAPRGLRKPNPIPTAAPIQTPTYEPPFQTAQPVQPVQPVQQAQPRPSITRPKKLKPTGEITHYLEKINVAIIKLSKQLQTGDLLIVEGDDCLFLQPVKEIQIDRNPVDQARKGDHIGMKVGYTARVGGRVYLI